MNNLKCISGECFNKLFPKTHFVKLFNKEFCHNNYRFEHGLNIDTNVFNEKVCSNGIYFCEIDKAPMWCRYKNKTMAYYCRIEIPPEAVVCIEKDKFKTNKIFLHHPDVIPCNFWHKSLFITNDENTETLIKRVPLQYFVEGIIFPQKKVAFF